MADKIFINKNDSGFPDYLDWESLRASGIDYLGNLTGKIWTDYNVHDPGITILEILCYALMDLGYRTNLPVEDILAKNPDDTENNFLTPSQILTCNPTTITDFRKMLIDIEGVKNAWLKDSFYECESLDKADLSADAKDFLPTNCFECYNGLYIVYVELENDYDLNNATQKKNYDDLIDNIRAALMKYRNLCEDFISIKILCKQKIGVCADIELEADANAEAVYKTVVEALRNFFSPSPKFYTLQQLLDKNKPVEDIFAGRPYNLQQSHGFVDTDELEKIELKKEIHLSDVYHVILDVPGVKNVKNLGLKKNCDDKTALADRKWIWKIRENFVPDFLPECSSFNFTRKGIPVTINTQKFASYFNLNFTRSGKVLYTMPSPYLDLEMPQGNYRSDLSDYKSIQNEFPRVYGIAKGGLSADASPLRKAQALQLKAYLLFFDQLLANYLMQLKNIRSLFSFSAADKNNQHTYFINQLTDVPDFQNLVQTESQKSGETLAVPVKKKWLQNLITNGTLQKINSEKDVLLYEFFSLNECDVAINILQQDFFYEDDEPQIYSNEKGCWFFYLFTSSDKIALFSKNFYESDSEATNAAAYIKYAATHKKSYQSFQNNSNKFSFFLRLSVSGYSNYLQRIVEDKNLFIQRREGFLNHLLARFAEQFTDFAMLSFGFPNEKKFAETEIANKEKFLSKYGELSANRGKAYDYLQNGWNNENISGFEKRFKAYCGIGDWRRKNLCHFEVVKYDEQVYINLTHGNFQLFKSIRKFDSRDEGNAAFQSLLKALPDKNNYSTHYSSSLRTYNVYVKDGNELFVYQNNYSTAEEAEAAINKLYQFFSTLPADNEIEASLYNLYLQLNSFKGENLFKKKAPFENGQSEIEITQGIVKDVNNKDAWEPVGKTQSQTELELHQAPQNKSCFINFKAFIPDDYAADRKQNFLTYRFLVYDNAGTFLFHSQNEFDSREAAIENSNSFLFLLIDKPNYKITQLKEQSQFRIEIKNQSATIAFNSTEYESREAAQQAIDEIYSYIQQQLYFLQTIPEEKLWKYNFCLCYPDKTEFVFNSKREDFQSRDEAYNELKNLKAATSNNSISKNNSNELEIKNAEQSPIAVYKLTANENADEAESTAKNLLSLKQHVNALTASANEQNINQYVVPDEISAQGDYAYRLVDKEKYYAFHLLNGDVTDEQKIKDTIKEVYAKYPAEYDVLDICLGGDIIKDQVDAKTNSEVYRYQIKSLNQFYDSGEELVLFESAETYASEEEAQNAFDENYLNILAAAMLDASYGTIISFEEISFNTNSCGKSETIAFIPKETMKKFGFNKDAAKQQLITYAKSYPIRVTQQSADDYKKFFSCKKDNTTPNDENRLQQSEEKNIYYFVLNNKIDEKENWISNQVYETVQQALQDFYFFLILLQYKGNYFVDYNFCNCTSRLYIREVLVESERRFHTQEIAWGAEGVQKFICVSQSANAFHNYLRDEDRCYSFYVACNSGLIHPCTYDTIELRDKALHRLHDAFVNDKDFLTNFTDVFKQDFSQEQIELNFFSHKVVYHRKMDSEDNCDNIFEIIDSILIPENIVNDDKLEKIYLKNKKGDIILTPSETISFNQWKELLNQFAYYFPITKISADNLSSEKYFVEIKLPSFCKEDLSNKPCDCNGDEKERHCCAVTWMSDCCFENCDEALRQLEYFFACIENLENYHPVFDCECGPFRINLNCKCDERSRQNQGNEANAGDIIIPNRETNFQRFIECCNEIIARNPQCYTTPKMNCNAVERAKRLINNEGLHLIEHILLRPHCEEDCKCLIPHCFNDDANRQNKINCNDWVWKETGDISPCDEKTIKGEDGKYIGIKFVPGDDPYSFIATVVLPAWAERFRKKENRLALENILYREAPAHVMLRILWLSPKDICKFESLFKYWNVWLSGDKCFNRNFTCSLIEFLFRKNFECLNDCYDCIPCNSETTIASCFEEESDPCINRTILNNINELYCWKPFECDKKSYVQWNEDTANAIAIEPALAVAEERPLPETKEEIVQLSSKEKMQFNNKRYAAYKINVSEIVANSGQNEAAGKTLSFLSDPNPSTAKFIELIQSILDNKADKQKNIKALSARNKKDLISNVTWYFLDKISFNGGKDETINELKNIFETMRNKKIDTNVIFRKWEAKEVKRAEPDVNIELIKSVMTK